MQKLAGDFVDHHLHEIADLREQFVLTGGATIGLWLTDASAPTARPTNDVDLVVLCETRAGYERYGERFRARGWGEDDTSRVICRWRNSSGLIIDMMPTEGSMFGFGSRWFRATYDHAARLELPSGLSIRCATPALLIATKLMAFWDRGSAYPLASHDLSDIIALVDGRPEIVADVHDAPDDVRSYIRDQLDLLDAAGHLAFGIMGFLPPSATGQARESTIQERLNRIRS